MKKMKKSLAAFIFAVMMACLMIPQTAQAASPKLSPSTKTVYVGKTAKITLKNNKKTVKWSVSNSRIKITKKTKTYVQIKGVKTGTAYVKAKIGTKTYKCKVTVKASAPTARQKQALKAAKNYLSIMPFSYQGLIKQLKYDKYTQKEAEYGAKNCGANWSKQALKAAKNYLKVSAFSKKGLISQLKYDKYTTAQAEYGAKNCGANWNNQAAKKAKSYLKLGLSFTRSQMIDQLEYDGFTHSQAVYGAKKAGL